MLLKSLLVKIAAILFIFGMTMAVFVEAQGDRYRNHLSLASDDSETAPLFDNHLSEVFAEQHAFVILATIGLVGELLCVLAWTTGLIGLGLHVTDGIGELFQALLDAIDRLFARKRKPIDPPDLPDRDDDPGMNVFADFPRHPRPPSRCAYAVATSSSH